MPPQPLAERAVHMRVTAGRRRPPASRRAGYARARPSCTASPTAATAGSRSVALTTRVERYRSLTRNSGAGPSTSRPRRAAAPSSSAAASAACLVGRRTRPRGSRSRTADSAAPAGARPPPRGTPAASCAAACRRLAADGHSVCTSTRPPAGPAAAAAGELGDQRERALLGAEVGKPQVGVRVLDDGQLHVREVVALRDHLRADQDRRRRGARSARRTRGDAALAPRRRRRRAGTPASARAPPAARPRGAAFRRRAARPRSSRSPGHACGARLGVAAVMADQPLRLAVAVQREGDVAAAAHPRAPAIAAVDERRPAAAGDEHDRLPAALARPRSSARARIRVQRVPQATHVEQLDRRQRRAVDALRQRQPRHAQPALGPRRRASRRAAPRPPAARAARPPRARRSGDRSPACRRSRAPRRRPSARGRRAARTRPSAARRRCGRRRCAAAATRRSARRGRAWSAGSRRGHRTAPRSGAPSAA